MKKWHWCLIFLPVVAHIIFILCMAYGRPKTLQLIEAIETENVERVQEILDDGVDPNRTNVPISWIWTFLETSPSRPLSVACKTGNKEIVELLISYGATAEIVDGTGWSPLIDALWHYQPEDVEIVRLLLENGADPYCEDNGTLPMFLAASMRPRVFDALKTNGTIYLNEYDEETAEGITEIVKMLMVEEQKDERGYSGKSILIISVIQENIPLTEYLLSIGCDTTVKDSFGKTALDYAVEAGNEEILYLLEKEE